MTFSMSRAWNDAMALVKKNFGLLAVLAGLFLFLPQGILYVVYPEALAMQGQVGVGASMPAGEASGGFVAASLVLALVQIFGLTAMTALLDQHRRPTVGEAMATAGAGFLSVFACMMILIIVFVVITVAILAAVGVDLSGGAPTPEAAGRLLLIIALLVPVLLYFGARFAVLLPVIVLEGIRNPIRAIARSWRLVGPAHWRMFGFYVLLVIAAIVLLAVVGMVFGVLGAIANSQGIGVLLNAIVSALANMVFVAISVAVYQQLAGPTAAAIGETFE